MDTTEKDTWIPAPLAAVLSGCTVKTIVKRIHAGKLVGKLSTDEIFTEKGEGNYLVLLETMSHHAQEKYYLSKMSPEQQFNIDLTTLSESFGKAGLSKYEKIAEMLSEAARIRQEYRSDKSLTQRLDALAKSYGVSYRTLLRYEKKDGLIEISKLYLDPCYMQDHLPYSLCLLSVDLSYYLFLVPHNKYTRADIFREHQKLKDQYDCTNCVYKVGTTARAKYCKKSLLPVPECKKGCEHMPVATSQDVVNDLLRHVPKQLICFSREGQRVWNAIYGHFIIRDAPLLTCLCFEGDHHVLNCFVRVTIRRTIKGKAQVKEVLVRPVLTAWMDIATGAIVGWVISILPNSKTIAEALCRACVYTVGDEYHGIPRCILVDCGADYKSKMLEDIPEEFKDRVPENDMITNKLDGFGLISAMNIEILHALPYHPQTKKIERVFGTLENGWISKQPGWCYEDASKRPPNFQKDLKKKWESGELPTMEEFVYWFRNTCLKEYHLTYRYDTPVVVEDAEPESFDPGEWHTPINALSPLEAYRRLPKARDLTPTWASMSILKKARRNNVACTRYGIQCCNAFYWHEDLSWLINSDQHPSQIDILYNEPLLKEVEAPASITVLYQKKFYCEAYIANHTDHVNADSYALQEHFDEKQRHISELQKNWTRLYRVMNTSKLLDISSLRYETYGAVVDKERDSTVATDLTNNIYKETNESPLDEFMADYSPDKNEKIAAEDEKYMQFFGDIDF